MRQVEKTHDHWRNRIPRVSVGGAAVDVGVVAGLYTRVGMGQSAALVRYRGDPWLPGVVVGKFLVDFQPGRQLAGGGDFLVHRHWLAACDRTISGRRNGVHVGYTRTALGASPF